MQQRGLTLVELMMASILLAIMTVAIGAGSHLLGGASIQLRDRAHSAAQLRLAVEHLCEDLGAADKLKVNSRKKLTITLEDDAADLAGYDRVVYKLDGNRLVRTVKPKGDPVTVSRDLLAFEIDSPFGEEVYVRLATGRLEENHSVRLTWTPREEYDDEDEDDDD